MLPRSVIPGLVRFRSMSDLSSQHSRVLLVSVTVIAAGLSIAINWQTETSHGMIVLMLIGFLWLFFLSLTGRLRTGILFIFATFVVSTTISRERLGIPLELEVITAPLLGVAILVLYRRRVATWRSFPLVVPLAGYVAANFLSTFANHPIDPNSLRQSFIVLARALSLYLVVITVQLNSNYRFSFPKILSGVFLVQAGMGVLALMAYPRIETPLIWPGLHGPDIISLGGLFQEPNLFGIFALSVTAISLPQLFIAGSGKRSWSAVIVAVGLLSIYLSFTRSTWFGLAAVLAVFLLLLPLTRGLKPRSGLSLTLLVSFLATGFIFLSLGLLRFYGIDSPLILRIEGIFDPQISYSLLGRLQVWRLAIGDWLESPIVGRGLLSLTLPSTPGWLYGSMIQALHDSGILGLGFMIWLHVAAWRLCWRALRTAVDRRDKIGLLGYLLAMIGIFITSQFSSIIWTAYWWLILGLAIGHSVHILSTERISSATATNRPRTEVDYTPGPPPDV